MSIVLTTFAEQKRDTYETFKINAQIDFSNANDELAAVSENYETLVSESVELDRDIASKRAQLSHPNNMPADITTLTDELRDLLIDRRHLAAALKDAAEILNTTKAMVIHNQSRLTAATNALKVAETEFTQAQARGQRHDNWTAVEVEDAITEVRDAAAALLADTFTPDPDAEINPAEILTDATVRIESDIPEVLRDRARARSALVADKVSAYSDYRTSIQADTLSHQSSVSGSAGLVTQRWAEYDTTENNLKIYALNTVTNYHRAIDLLQNINASNALTVAESDRIAALAVAVDADSMTTEIALHDARAAVTAKQLELELAGVAALVTDVNADPSADPDVQARQAELTALEADLSAAETAHTDGFATEMDLWEAAIPDFIWANLLAYDTAQSLLTTISTSDGVALTTAFTDAETALVSALTADDDNRKLSNALSATLAAANTRTNYVNETRRALSLSALRGDY